MPDIEKRYGKKDTICTLSGLARLLCALSPTNGQSKVNTHHITLLLVVAPILAVASTKYRCRTYHVYSTKRLYRSFTMATIFEPAFSTSTIRPPLSSANAPSMADTLPSINFGFDDLRNRMAQFTTRFDDFIDRGRKRVLEERNQFRINLVELQGTRNPPPLPLLPPPQGKQLLQPRSKRSEQKINDSNAKNSTFSPKNPRPTPKRSRRNLPKPKSSTPPSRP